jgi:outer membrane biosynthesis protein TonB
MRFFVRVGILGLVLSLILAVGCQHAAPPPAEGASSFRIVKLPEPPPAEKPKGEVTLAEPSEGEVLVDAEPIGPLAEPVYPAEALAGHAGMTTIGVHLTVSSAGHVSDVTRSVIGITTPSPFEPQFRAAVEKAVRQWRFNPAEIRTVKRETRGTQTYWSVLRTEKTETALDVSFTFTATGGVIGLPPPQK